MRTVVENRRRARAVGCAIGKRMLVVCMSSEMQVHLMQVVQVTVSAFDR